MGRLVSCSDDLLVQASLDGDTTAFAALMLRYGEAVVALIRRRVPNAVDAEDILQETLLSAWLHLATLSNAARVKPWLLQIARNSCRDYYRSPLRRDVPVHNEPLEHLVNRYGRAEGPELAEVELRDAFNRLPSPMRLTAQLFYLEDLPISQIAEQLRCPTGTVKSRLHSARNHLRHLLEPDSTKGDDCHD